MLVDLPARQLVQAVGLVFDDLADEPVIFRIEIVVGVDISGKILLTSRLCGGQVGDPITRSRP
jgi:hypothetical protein